MKRKFVFFPKIALVLFSLILPTLIFAEQSTPGKRSPSDITQFQMNLASSTKDPDDQLANTVKVKWSSVRKTLYRELDEKHNLYHKQRTEKKKNEILAEMLEIIKKYRQELLMFSPSVSQEYQSLYRLDLEFLQSQENTFNAILARNIFQSVLNSKRTGEILKKIKAEESRLRTHSN